MIWVALLESEDPDELKNALSQITNRKRINQMFYKIEDTRLRMIFAALKEGVMGSQ